MTNNLNILDATDLAPFTLCLTQYLDDNMEKGLISSIATLIAIDYKNRLKSNYAIADYAELCATRIKQHLGNKVVMDEDFSSAMTLFVVAITPEKNKSDDQNNLKEEHQDILIDSIIALQFADLNPKEQQNIRLLLRDLLKDPIGKALMNSISSNPKLFYSVVFSAIKSKQKQHDVLLSVTTHLKQIFHHSNKADQSVINTQGLLTKLVVTGGILAASSLGAFISGISLPALAVPAMIVAVTVSSQLGQNIGYKVASNMAKVKNGVNILANLQKSMSIQSTSIALQNQLDSAQQGNLHKQELPTLTPEQDVESNHVGKNYKFAAHQEKNSRRR